jgi:hypothetical protein
MLYCLVSNLIRMLVCRKTKLCGAEHLYHPYLIEIG